MTSAQINWLLLANAALGNFLAGTSSRIFAVSLPTVANSLETTIVGISWAVIAYQISQISLSLIFGRIGGIYGRHTLFGLGLIVSSLAALACGLSQNLTQLILFRIFQDMGASMTQSQERALALETLPKESSGRARGFMTTAFRYYSGDPAATPTAANPEMFVRAMNFSFMVGGSMALLAMLSSALRGERNGQAH